MKMPEVVGTAASTCPTGVESLLTFFQTIKPYNIFLINNIYEERISSLHLACLKSTL
jgi:hypothetical protein